MRFIVLILLFFSLNINAQTIDSLNNQDTLKVHSVKKAIIFSAVVPGSGQIYNHLAMPKGKKKAYWKVPLIYAGLGTSMYFLLSNNQMQLELKNEYSLRQNDPTYFPVKWQYYDDAGILTLYDKYLKWRDLSILGFSAVYLLQVVDAAVEAHFVNFDVSEDLSMSLRPALMYGYSPGMTLSLNFR